MTAPAPGRGLPDVQGLVAGIVSRVTAAVADALVVVLLLLAGQFGYAAVRLLLTGPPFSYPDLDQRSTTVIGCGVLVLYLAGCWFLSGRTVGDQLMGLRVTGRSGRRLAPWTALLRAVLCVLAPWGLLWIPVSRRGASVQDVVVGSRVVHDWYGEAGHHPGRGGITS